MKLLCASDLHNSKAGLVKLSQLLEKNEYDALAFAGDVTELGPREFLDEFIKTVSKSEIQVFAVTGNRDFPEFEDVLVEKNLSIHAKKVRAGEYDFVGLNASNPTPFGCPNTRSEDEIYSILEPLVDENTVLISHTPPNKTKADEIMPSVHIGSFSVRKIIEEKKPFAVICGHAHEGIAGVELLERTRVVKTPCFRDSLNALELELPSFTYKIV